MPRSGSHDDEQRLGDGGAPTRRRRWPLFVKSALVGATVGAALFVFVFLGWVVCVATGTGCGAGPSAVVLIGGPTLLAAIIGAVVGRLTRRREPR